MGSNNNNKDDIGLAIAHQLLQEMKEKDVRVASWLLILITIGVGIVKMFTTDYINFFEKIGKSVLINDPWIGFIMILLGLLMILSMSVPKIKKISLKRLAIVSITCSWTYLFFEYLMITIFIRIGISWLIILGIIGICFYVMVRGDYD